MIKNYHSTLFIAYTLISLPALATLLHQQPKIEEAPRDFQPAISYAPLTLFRNNLFNKHASYTVYAAPCMIVRPCQNNPNELCMTRAYIIQPPHPSLKSRTFIPVKQVARDLTRLHEHKCHYKPAPQSEQGARIIQEELEKRYGKANAAALLTYAIASQELQRVQPPTAHHPASSASAAAQTPATDDRALQAPIPQSPQQRTWNLFKWQWRVRWVPRSAFKRPR